VQTVLHKLANNRFASECDFGKLATTWVQLTRYSDVVKKAVPQQKVVDSFIRIAAAAAAAAAAAIFVSADAAAAAAAAAVEAAA